MSMHEIEDYIEEAIRVVSRSDMPVSEKRSMIYSLLRLEEYGDCGFTNLRTLKEMMDCQYTFVFDKTEMYDYEANRGYYDDLSKKGGCSQGAPYTLVARDAVTNEWVKHGDKVCIDSGSDAWRGMVAAGAIAGEGAAPVERLENLDVLRKVKKLWGPMDDYFMQAHGGLFLLSGARPDPRRDETPAHRRGERRQRSGPRPPASRQNRRGRQGGHPHGGRHAYGVPGHRRVRRPGHES